MALTWFEFTLPLKFRVYEDLHLLNALGAIKDTFVVVPDFQGFQTGIFIEVNMNF